MSKRCSCHATTTNRICRNPFVLIIDNKKLCIIHGRMLFNKTTIIIQKNFRAFKIRQKLNNIVNKLPRDLQQKIIWHIREQYYIEREHKIIQNILNKKALNIFREASATKLACLDYYESVVNLYRLCIKYMLITSVSDDNNLYYNKNNILNYYNTLYTTRTYSPQDHDKANKLSNLLFNKVTEYSVKYKGIYG